jgi:hypothetical protein
MNHARESSRRLSDLLRSEHGAMADFLVALAEFDRARLWVRLGFSNLFEYLHRELGLSRGSAHYRKVAAQLVQRFPEVVEPLRSGKLCITVVLELAKVITPENRAEVLPRFFHRSKQEAKAVAVEIRPAEVVPRKEMVTALPGVSRTPAGIVQPVEPGRTVELGPNDLPKGTSLPMLAPPERGASIEPLTPELRRLHMTVTKTFVDKLDAARKGQGHAQPGASAEKVLEAALDLLLAQQAKRRAEVRRPQQNPRSTKNPGHVPAAVKRAVWARDEGKCQFPLDSGGICGSTLRLEIDHIRPLARGGQSTVANCRLACRFHNQLAARQVYGDDWMDLFTRGPGGDVPVARESEAPGCYPDPFPDAAQAARTCASRSREMPARSLACRSAGSVFHQASVSRAVSATGRNRNPSATARAIETCDIPLSAVPAGIQAGMSLHGSTFSFPRNGQGTQTRRAFEPMPIWHSSSSPRMGVRVAGPTALKVPVARRPAMSIIQEPRSRTSTIWVGSSPVPGASTSPP